MARITLASGLVDAVWLVPCLAHRLGKQPVSFEHRLAMCSMLAEAQPGLDVSAAEAALARPGHTLDLVRKLRVEHPGHLFRMVAGADIYHQRLEWHRYEEVARLAPPIYIARAGEDPIPEPTLEAPPDIRSSSLRDALARGEHPQDAMPRSIFDYIRQHGLYRADVGKG